METVLRSQVQAEDKGNKKIMGHTLNTKWFIVLGEKKNRVTIIKEAPPFIYKSGRKRRRILCKCDCGNEFTTFFESFYLNKINSCGCYHKEKMSEMMIAKADPLRKHHLYKKWLQMLGRCGDKKNKKYGGRGISVCKEWMEDYHKFYYWSLANGYSQELEIDRIDNDKGYSPYNCRWVTREVNANNKRNNVFVVLNGDKISLRQACKRLGRLNDYKSIHHRVHKYGFTFEQAIETPFISRKLSRK